MKKYMFVCSGNTCRSPMAQGIFGKMLEEKQIEAEAFSCGVSTFAGIPATDEAVSAAAEYGADISSHRSTPFNPLMANGETSFVCMTSSHAQFLRAMGVEEGDITVLDISDPYGGDCEVYKECAKEIYDKLKELIK